MDKETKTNVQDTEENQIVEAQYVYEEPEIQLEGGSALQLEGGQKFPNKQEAKEQFILFRAFWFCYRNTMNFLSALWTCQDGKCKPTKLGWLVILISIGLFVYFSFFTGGKGA